MNNREFWLEIYRLHVLSGQGHRYATKCADEAVEQAPAPSPRKPTGLESGASLRGAVYGVGMDLIEGGTR
jgi:hypothetical protein